MKKLFHKKGFYIACAAVVLAIVSALSLFSSMHGADPAAHTLGALVTPLKRAVSGMADDLEKIYCYMYKYDQLEEENLELKKQLSQLQAESRDASSINEENERLRELLEFSKRHEDFEYAPAPVVSWSASSWSSSFSIGTGSNGGVELGDCVVDAYGTMVGRITEVAASSAVVTTILDTTSSCGAVVSATGATGIVSGDFSLMKSGSMKLQYLVATASAASGDAVVSSGKGGAVPQGLLIGTVGDVVISKSGTEDYAVIYPAVDFASLSEVYVITSFDVKE